jgi:hypothetical protein
MPLLATAQSSLPTITETGIITNNTTQALTAGTDEISKNTEVIVYNEDLALVKEKRQIDLKNGSNNLEYTNVASKIDPSSVLVEDPTNNKTTVLEQQYQYDLINSSNLLDEYLEKEITVTDGEGKTDTGKLLSHDDKSIVLERNDGSIVALEASKIEFSNASGLLTKPTLVWQIYSPTSGKRNLTISYLTGGLSWNTNYIVKTNTDSTKANIRSWISIDNKAGITFDDAKLKLVAGDIHRISASEPMYQSAKMTAETAPSSARTFSEASLFEYHVYTLEKPVNLINNQVKQISLLSADSVPVKKELVFDSWKGDKVQVILNIDNSEATGLGEPLPKGVVRVYQQDSNGQIQFLGEDQIDHTPKGEKIKVTVGNAFDVIGKRTQIGFEQVSNNVERTSYKIEVNNSKSEAQNVTAVEHFDGDWEIVKSSDKYEKTNAFTVEFKVSVPANTTKTISYVVEKKVRPLVPIENNSTENSTTENITRESSIPVNTTTEKSIPVNTTVDKSIPVNTTTENLPIGNRTKQ